MCTESERREEDDKLEISHSHLAQKTINICLKGSVHQPVSGCVTMSQSHSDAENLSLSTHILDISRGRPADNVKVTLHKLVDGKWSLSNSCPVSTNKDGRVREFAKVDGEVAGTYMLKFEVDEYFTRLGKDSLYPFIEVQFKITDNSHYHIPLLLSPYGYSTYRGS